MYNKKAVLEYRDAKLQIPGCIFILHLLKIKVYGFATRQIKRTLLNDTRKIANQNYKWLLNSTIPRHFSYAISFLFLHFFFSRYLPAQSLLVMVSAWIKQPTGWRGLYRHLHALQQQCRAAATVDQDYDVVDNDYDNGFKVMIHTGLLLLMVAVAFSSRVADHKVRTLIQLLLSRFLCMNYTLQ